MADLEDGAFRRARPSLVTVILTALLIVAGAAPAAGQAAAPAPDLPAPPGATTTMGATATGVFTLEAELDRSFATVRSFARWDAVFPTAEQRQFLAEGRTLLLSIHPERTDGSAITWAEIATTVPGDALHDDLRRWADRLLPYQDQLLLTFNHEPETDRNLGLGTAEEFQAAWRQVMTVFADEGLAPQGRLFISTSLAYELPLDDRRAVVHWYPGDEWVDVAGGDAYNFFQCRPDEPAAWRELAEVIEGQRRWGLEHPTIELALPEFATVDDPADPARRAQWLRNARATLADAAYDQFSHVAYFTSFDASNPDCDFLFDDVDAARQAFYELVQDPALGGTAEVGGPPSRCSFTEADGLRSLEWTPSLDAASYRVLDGTTPVGSTDRLRLGGVAAPVDASAHVVVAVAAAGTESEPTPCSALQPPPPLAPPGACEWARDEGFITISWLPADDAVDYVVRRTVDGRGPYWRGRTAATELADSDLAAFITYTVSTKAVDGSTSTPTTCTDTSPPPPDTFGPPEGCSFLRSGGQVALAWDPVDGAISYLVHRTVDGGGPYWRGRPTEPAFVDTDRTAELTYSVTAKTSDGTLSDPAPCTDTTPPPPDTFGPPSTCESSRAGGEVEVTWDAVDGAVAYLVHRTVDGAGPYWQGRVDADEPLRFVNGDRAGELVYLVRATNSLGEASEPTVCADASPELVPPATCVVTTLDGVVTVTWDATDLAEDYIVSRTVDGSGPWWQARTGELTFSQPERAGDVVYEVAARSGTGVRSDGVVCRSA